MNNLNKLNNKFVPGAQNQGDIVRAKLGPAVASQNTKTAPAPKFVELSAELPSEEAYSSLKLHFFNHLRAVPFVLNYTFRYGNFDDNEINITTTPFITANNSKLQMAEILADQFSRDTKVVGLFIGIDNTFAIAKLKHGDRNQEVYKDKVSPDYSVTFSKVN